MTDDELRSLCEQELWLSSGDSAELADERAKAMSMYLGEPQGDEVAGRSQVRTREVLETVEWALPSLMRLFADADNICMFEPVGPEDEEAAKQETEVVNHAFWRQNRGFYNLYGFLKDGLLQKTGILKVWWDSTPQEEREEYKALNDWELSQLVSGSDDIEVVDYNQNEDGSHHISLVRRIESGKLCIEPCPPEEFGIDRDARSAYPEDASFVYHRTRKTKSDLVEQGYSRKLIEPLPAANDTLTLERNARRHLSDEQDREQADHWSMERVWITECYIRVDRDDDGIAELLKVTLAGADSAYTTGSTLIDVEEVDRQPFCVWSPVLLTHKFYGLSLMDLVRDLQEIKTTLTRQILDNTYLSNNGRTAVNEEVNLDDLMTSRPGGIVRTKGVNPPSQNIMPIPQQPVPAQTFELMGYLDEARQARVGLGEEVGALDANSLANINTGVAALAYDAARSKIELMARICAEIGLRPLFLRIHELMRKNGGKATAIRLSGGWVQVNPQEWRERADMIAAVGVGRVSRERRMVALSDILEKQATVAQGGGLGVLINATNMYRAITDYTKELGLEESLYWMDPEQAPPQQPQPDPQMMALEVQREMTMADAQVRSQKNQVDMAKVQQDGQLRMAEMELRRAELAMQERDQLAKAEMAQLNTTIKALEGEAKNAHGSAKASLDAELKVREQDLKMVQAQHAAENEAAKREVDILKAILQSGTTLTVEQMRQMGMDPTGSPQMDLQNVVNTFSQTAGQVGELQARVLELQGQLDEKRKPLKIQRDQNGRIAAVGDRRVVRDDAGRVVQVE